MSKTSIRQKLSIATWNTPRESNIYGTLHLDVTQVLKYIDEQRKISNEQITVTHFIGKVLAEALQSTPSMNGYIAWGRFNQHKTVDVTYLVDIDRGANLAKAKISNTDKKSLIQIAKELKDLANKLRTGKDESFKQSVSMIKFFPTFIIRPLLSLISFLTVNLGINAKSFGLEAYPFGSCVITNVGMFGIDEGFAPPVPFARVPLLVLVGAIKDQVVAIDKKIEVRPMVTLSSTIDHRLVDGFHISRMAKTMREYFENPWLLDNDD